VRDHKALLLYYEGTVEDITQRRQFEEKLRDSEALYQSLVETLPQNIFRKDLQERFTFGNQQFCKVLGIRSRRLSARPISISFLASWPRNISGTIER